MTSTTKILFVEHDPNDLGLIQYELRKGGIKYISEVVQTEHEYINALKKFAPDIILCDYSLPSFDGPSAFNIREETAPDVPFIFVSGTIGEENSIEYIKNGLTDYSLKDKLFTLASKVNRALKEAKDKLEKHKTEEERIQSEKRLARAQHVAHMGSWEVDFASNVTLWSDENCRIFGLSPNENRQSLESFLTFVHPLDLGFVSKTIKDGLASLHNTSFYHRIIRKDGTVRHIHSETSFEFDEKGKPKGLSGICHDVTDIKKLEDDLRVSEANIRTVFETTNIGFLLMDLGCNILAVNRILTRWSKSVFGYDFNKGTNLKGELKPERLAEFEKMIDAVTRGEQIDYETKYPDVQGKLKWFVVNGKPVIDERQKIIGVCLSIQDITQRKQVEQQIIELNQNLEWRVLERTAQLSEANKALEAFSYSVSHDLRAPVRALTGFTKIIQKDHASKFEPALQELFQYVEGSGKQMSTIIEDLLRLAKYGKEKLKNEPIEMNALVMGIWLNISRNSPHNAQIKLAELPIVMADMSMMQQVVINLLSNAIKYSSKKDKPVVTIWCEQTDNGPTIYFKDNGAGFDMVNYDKLFGAFQRLHGRSEFEGTGVGLSLVKNIIEKHGGTVGAEAKVGKGATFYFTLPMVAISKIEKNGEIN